MGFSGYQCPHCATIGTYRNNIFKHLTGRAPKGHELSAGEAESAIALIERGGGASSRAGAINSRVSRSSDEGGALNEGHRRSLNMLQDAEAVRATLALYRELATPAGVYLRPASRGLTVISLDPSCGSMIGVGARGNSECYLTAIPPTRSQVERAAAGYKAKLASLQRPSLEERYALSCIRSALENRLVLPRERLVFVCQEWRLVGRGKMDLLAFEPDSGRLVVVELKATQSAAQAAAPQARGYADALFQRRAELYPFFHALVEAMASVYGAFWATGQFPEAPEAPPEIRLWAP